MADVKSALATARLKAEGGRPACVELQLVTFNQHAGPTPGWPDDPLRIALEDGLVVRSAPEDPVFQIQKSLEKSEFDRMSSETMKVHGYDVELH